MEYDTSVETKKVVVLLSCEMDIGGWGSRDCLSAVDRLGDLKAKWINSEPMPTQRAALAAVNCDDAVYAVGGRYGTHNVF